MHVELPYRTLFGWTLNGRTLVWALESGEIVNNFEESLKLSLIFDNF